MKKLKRAAAFAAAAVITAVSVCGCNESSDYSLTADGKKVNAGVYINFILSEMSNQMNTMYYSGEITDPAKAFDQKIDGKDFKTYVKDEAIKNTKEFAAVNAKFDELGLKLSKEDKKAIKDSVSQNWESSQEFFEKEGVGRESVEQCAALSYKKQAIFDYYYAEGGKEEVTLDTINKYVADNYIRYKVISIPKSMSEDEKEAEKENKENEKLLKSYKKQAKKMSFEDFDKLIEKYNKYAEEKSAEGQDEAADGQDEEADTKLDSAADSAVDADSSAVDTADTDTDSESSDDKDSKDDKASKTDSEAEEDAETEEETDPYANEIITNYTQSVDKNNENYVESSAKMLEKFKKAKFETADTYEDDYYYYLFMTDDVSKREDYGKENRDMLLQVMKKDDFDKLVESWTDSMKIVVNDKAVKRYTVQEVYDRQEEYYKSQGQG